MINYRRILLHNEYAAEAREGGKILYAYRTFTENYGKYAKKVQVYYLEEGNNPGAPGNFIP